MASTPIESILNEHRSFAPPDEFVADAVINSQAEYERLYAQANPETFWAELAKKELHWFQAWDEKRKQFIAIEAFLTDNHLTL
jgi:acetyl-CoA synthetase